MTEMLKQSIQFIQSLHGWCSKEKAEALAEIVVQHKPKVCVELGVFGGRSLIVIGLALREVGECGMVWGIDPWTVDAAIEGNVGEANADWWKSIDIQDIRNKAMSAVTSQNLWANVSVIVAKSENVASLFNQIDFLHVDSNHSEEKSTLDVHLWSNRVKSGGHILFDDADWISTQKALSELKEHYADVIRDIVTPETGSICRVFRKR